MTFSKILNDHCLLDGYSWHMMEEVVLVGSELLSPSFFLHVKVCSIVIADVNECLVLNGGCEWHCINTEGGHRCECVIQRFN